MQKKWMFAFVIAALFLLLPAGVTWAGVQWSTIPTYTYTPSPNWRLTETALALTATRLERDRLSQTPYYYVVTNTPVPVYPIYTATNTKVAILTSTASKTVTSKPSNTIPVTAMTELTRTVTPTSSNSIYIPTLGNNGSVTSTVFVTKAAPTSTIIKPENQRLTLTAALTNNGLTRGMSPLSYCSRMPALLVVVTGIFYLLKQRSKLV